MKVGETRNVGKTGNVGGGRHVVRRAGTSRRENRVSRREIVLWGHHIYPYKGGQKKFKPC